MNNKKLMLYTIVLIAILAVAYAGLNYIFSPRLIYGADSCFMEKKVEFGRNILINDCGHNLDLQIDRSNYTNEYLYFVNLTSFKIDGEDYIKRVNEGDPVQIIIYEGMVNIRTKPNLVFGKKQGIIFMRPDKENKDWTVIIKQIGPSGATLRIVHS